MSDQTNQTASFVLPTPEDTITTLNRRFVRLSVSIKIPNAYPRLNATEQEVADRAGTTKSKVSARARQVYAECPTISKGTRTLQQFKSDLHKMSLPYLPTSDIKTSPPRLLKIDKLNQALKIYAKAKRANETFLEREFTEQVYNDELAEAKRALGALADQVTWPSYEKLHDSFKLDFNAEALPADEPRFDQALCSAETLEVQRKLYQLREKRMVTAGFEQIKSELTERVRALATMLVNGIRLHDGTRFKCTVWQPDMFDIATYLGKDLTVIKTTLADMARSATFDLDGIKKDMDARKAKAREMLAYVEQIRAW